jgi:diguanylate cyclase (GGDEF)-like protein/PAS domain S-box-containing protein
MSKVICDEENRSPLSPLSGIDDRFRIIFDAVTDGIFISNPATGQFIEINQPGCSMFGYNKSELIGRDIETLSSGVHPYTQDMAIEWIEKARLGEPQTFEWQCKTNDDVLFWAEISIRYMEFDPHSVGMRVRIPAIVAIVRNIAERKLSERALQRLNRTLRTLSAANAAVVRATTEEELLNDMCRVGVELGGYRLVWIGFVERDEAKTVRPVAWAGEHPEFIQTANITWAETERGLGPTGTAIRTGEAQINQDVETNPVMTPWRAEMPRYDFRAGFALPLKNKSEVFGSLTFYTDEPDAFGPEEVDLLKELAADLAFGIYARRAKERLTIILATIDNVIWSVAADTYETLYLNPAAERIYGRPASAFYADSELFMNIVHPEDRPRVAEMLPELIEKGTMTIQYRIVRPDGEVRWLEDNTAIARDADGRPVRFDGVASDITERKAHEAHVLYLATYDALTGLPNRNLLSDRLTQDIAHAQRGGHTITVLVLGLDRFKLINDSYGHDFGDALLRELANRLRSCVRAGDTVARLRGDEFAVLLSPLNNPKETIPAVRRLLNIFSHPFVIHHVELHATARVGIAVFPTDGRGLEILLKNAGAAMNQAKSLGRNGFQFFAPEMDAHATERLELETALKRALERTEFEVHYQPQIHVKTSQVVAVEALVRWRHPTQGLMPPGQFIGVAEETGLIVPIGAWVLRAACAQNKAWQDAGLPHLRMSVNVSAKQFWGGRIVDTVRRVLKETDLPPSDLELEITESVFLRDIEETVRTLSELRSMGVAISLDDFGTGYSSLNYLRRLPIDQLKIDGSFIRDLSANPNAAVLLSQIIRLGHAMHLEVVAECVETEAEYAFLADNDCDLVQGYYLHKPLSSTVLGQLLKERA